MESVTRVKSKAFAIRIINLYKYLCDDKKEFVLSKQILRSGTSIGANLAESEVAMSKKDFISKVYISLKECSETIYWLELLYETDYLSKEQFNSLFNDCIEIKKLLMSTTKTLKQSLEFRV